VDGVTDAAGEEATSTSTTTITSSVPEAGSAASAASVELAVSAASVELAGLAASVELAGPVELEGLVELAGPAAREVRGTLVESAVPVALEAPGVGAASGNIALSIEAARRMEIGRRRTALAAARPALPPERARPVRVSRSTGRAGICRVLA
jgi:hypothetical protein